LLETDQGFFERIRAVCSPTKGRECESYLELDLGPWDRDALAGEFLQRQAVDVDGLLQVLCAALALAEAFECAAQVQLGLGPVERRALAGEFLQR
jgi:hypothetical protein